MAPSRFRRLILGIGPTVGIFGNVADPVASTLAGNFTDSVSRTLLAGTGSLDVGTFINRVAVGTAKDFAFSQLNQTGLPLALGVATQTAAFTSDVYGAFRDVLTPPVPVYVRPPVTPEQVSNIDPETGKDTGSSDVQLAGHIQRNPYVQPRRLPPVGPRPVRMPEVDDSRYRLDQEWLSGEDGYELPPLRETFSYYYDSYFEGDVSGGYLMGSVNDATPGYQANPYSLYVKPLTAWMDDTTPLHSAPLSNWEISKASLGVGAGEAWQSVKRLGGGLAQPFLNYYDAGTMLFETAQAFAGFSTRPHTVYGEMASAAEAGVGFGELASGTGKAFATGVADTVTFGGYASYEYAHGYIDDREYGDRLVGAGISLFGARGSIGATAIGKASIGEVPGMALQSTRQAIRTSADVISRVEVDLSTLGSTNISNLRLAPKSAPGLGLPAPTKSASKTLSPRLPGPTVDPVGGFEVGQFISTPNGLLPVPKGGSWGVRPNGVDIHSYYPNGSNAYRINPFGHPNNPTPHMHLHQPGTGPGMQGQGPSLDINGNIVPWNSAGAHWPLP